MGLDRGPFAVGFSRALAEVADEFVEGLKLLGRRFFLVEIAHQTDAKGDVVEVVAVDVAAVDLFLLAVADFDLAVARGGAVADDKVVGETVGHLADL